MAIVNFFRSKYPTTDFHELNIDSFIKMVIEHEGRIDALEEWKTQHQAEYEALLATVNSMDDRVEALETWKTTHQAAFNELVGVVEGLGVDVSGLKTRMTAAETTNATQTTQINKLNIDLARAINDSIQRDALIDQRLIDLIEQAGGDGIVFMNENIIAYAQEFRFIDELSAMYSEELNSNAWYVFEDLDDFTTSGFETGRDCYIFLGALSALTFPLTLSIKRGGTVYKGSFANSSSSVSINGITATIATNAKGAWLKLDTNAGDNITALKLENGLVGTPFNTNTFSEYLKIFRNIVKDVIDENIFNTERITISGLDCNLVVYDVENYPDTPTSTTKIGDATINYQITNSVVMGQVTVIGDPTLVIDATDATKVVEIQITGTGIEELPISALQTDTSWTRVLVGSSVIRYPGAINAFYQKLVSGNTEVDHLSGLVSGRIPPKVFDTTIISFGISYPLPGNITSLDNTNF